MRLAAAAAAAALVLLPLGCDDVDATEIVDAEQLAALADDVGHDVYWVGERPDTRLEWEQTAERLVYVRYLPAEGDVDDAVRDDSLTIGTYPSAGAYERLLKRAKRPRVFSQGLPEGGIVVVDRDNASSAHIAYPDSDLEIEVYAPDPATVLELATSGDVVPISE